MSSFLRFLVIPLVFTAGVAVASPKAGADDSDSGAEAADTASRMDSDAGTEAQFESPTKPKPPHVRGPSLSRDGDPSKDPNMEVDPD